MVIFRVRDFISRQKSVDDGARSRGDLERKSGCIDRQVNGLRHPNGIIALFRRNPKSKVRNSSQVFEKEEAMRRRTTAQESWEEKRTEQI
jgi:hypothetical protein